MNIHEYQAKDIFKKYGIPVQRGSVVTNVDEARRVVTELNAQEYVIKAQIHAGGRGKGGGIQLAKTREHAVAWTHVMLNKRIKTAQTGSEGKIVRKVLILEAKPIEKSLYLAIVIDRSKSCPVIIATPEGGVEIEKLAKETPEALYKYWIHPSTPLTPEIAMEIAQKLDPESIATQEIQSCILALYKIFDELDCSLAEINPLAIVGKNEICAIDAKLNFDDNALFRHPEIVELRDFDEENPLEIEADIYGLNYIKLEGGSVGCMVNGAGLAMATMDIIKLKGASPANFLDVGGGVSEDAVANAFRILVSDPDVKAVLINIFGGIVRCDLIAKGILKALEKIDVNVPMVLRFQGTNAEQAREMIKSATDKFIFASTMDDAATKVVEALNQCKGGLA